MVTNLGLTALVTFCALCLACSAGSGPGAESTDATARRDSITIAVVPFGLASGSPLPPLDVAEIIRRDLESIGRHATMAVADLPARPTRLGEVEFETWRASEADYLVVGLVASVHDGGHEVEFRLIDPRAETTLVGYLMPSAPDALEQTAHRVATLILEQLAASAPDLPGRHAVGAPADGTSGAPTPREPRRPAGLRHGLTAGHEFWRDSPLANRPIVR